MAGRYDPYDFNANAPILPDQAQAGMGGVTGDMTGAPIGAPTTIQPSKLLTKNPMLTATPLGAYTDSQYEAAVAQLRNSIQKQYADILQQIGYKDDSGNFIPGTVEADAQKQQAELQRSMGLAGEEVTQQHQREGTLFSGLRGQNQGRAEHPFVSALADLATQTPLTLNKLYEQAAGLTDEFGLQNNLLLADAAARASAGFGSQPGQYDAPAAPVDPNAALGVTSAIQPGQTNPYGNPEGPWSVGTGVAPATALRSSPAMVPTNPGWGAAATLAKKQAAQAKKSPYYYGGGTQIPAAFGGPLRAR